MPEFDHDWEALNGGEIDPDELIRQIIQNSKEQAILAESDRHKWAPIERFSRERDSLIKHFKSDLDNLLSTLVFSELHYNEYKDIFLFRFKVNFYFVEANTPNFIDINREVNKCLDYLKSNNILSRVIELIRLHSKDNYAYRGTIIFKVKTHLPELQCKKSSE